MLPQLVSHILSWECWKLPAGVVFQQVRTHKSSFSLKFEFAHIKVQRCDHTIHTIIAFEAAHAQNGIWGIVPRPLPCSLGCSYGHAQAERRLSWVELADMEINARSSIWLQFLVETFFFFKSSTREESAEWYYPLANFPNGFDVQQPESSGQLWDMCQIICQFDTRKELAFGEGDMHLTEIYSLWLNFPCAFFLRHKRHNQPWADFTVHRLNEKSSWDASSLLRYVLSWNF